MTANYRPHSAVHRLCLYYMSLAIAFEVLGQILFLRLLGVPYVAQSMLALRLLVDIGFVTACFLYGLRTSLFRGPVVNLFFILVIWGFVLGTFNQNGVAEIIKDLLLFLLFALKFAIFKGVFSSGEDQSAMMQKLRKYCVYTLYVAIFSLGMLMLLRAAGFVFYQQGISNLEWYVSYAVASNKPMAALLGVLVAFLLAKRMVLIACLTIFLLPMAMKFFRFNPRIFLTVTICGIIGIGAAQFMTFRLEDFAYAIRLDFGRLGREAQGFSLETLQRILILMDYARYAESMSALNELGTNGIIFGGGFGFNYFDTYTQKVISNAHFSPVGMITKVGLFGMIAFYAVFIYGSIVGLASRHPMVRLCGFYLVATMIGSLFTWKFFLSAPLLPLAFAVALYSGRAPRRARFQGAAQPI